MPHLRQNRKTIRVLRQSTSLGMKELMRLCEASTINAFDGFGASARYAVKVGRKA
jgi:hypothetical protein